MIATELLQKIGDTLGSTATVKSVFGEPIHLEGKIVVPVAKVAYGFGAGGGAGSLRGGAEGAPKHEGGGGGGGVRAFPAGALEITGKGTRFVTFRDTHVLLGVFAAGAVLGGLLWARRSR